MGSLLREQVVLGGAKFLARLRAPGSGNRQEQRGAGRLLVERSALDAVVAAVENVKGLPWPDFRDRNGDTGREMTLTLGRRLCGLKVAEVAQAVGLRNYGVATTSVKRCEGRLAHDRAERERRQQRREWFNCEI
ncbi:MAG TPA: hypothetical protein PKM73_08500 [Verrucomicrobiota bacterium]|nr:hypothetical protein [Verrucomicrobiota bacterium]HNU51844.1 hypothetical protein [Verrucomicrobiota bacterium]